MSIQSCSGLHLVSMQNCNMLSLSTLWRKKCSLHRLVMLSSGFQKWLSCMDCDLLRTQRAAWNKFSKHILVRIWNAVCNQTGDDIIPPHSSALICFTYTVFLKWFQDITFMTNDPWHLIIKFYHQACPLLWDNVGTNVTKTWNGLRHGMD